MELKGYQKTVIADLVLYLEIMNRVKNVPKTYDLYWQDKGLLAPNSAIIRLRTICIDYVGKDEALQEVERLVSLEAMKYVIKN